MLVKMKNKHCYVIYEEHSNEESTTRNIICYCASKFAALEVKAKLDLYLEETLAGRKVEDPIWEMIAPMCDSESEFIYKEVSRFTVDC